jgi:hypothetical protein
MNELLEAKLEQLTILKHAFKIREKLTDVYSESKFDIIIKILKESEYYNDESKIININSIQLQELFKSKNINNQEILVTLGRNKIAYKKYIYRPRVNHRQVTLYNVYNIFLS